MKKYLSIAIVLAAALTTACTKTDAPVNGETTEITTENQASAAKEPKNIPNVNIPTDMFEVTGEYDNEIAFGSDNGNIVVSERTEEEDSIYDNLPETEEQVMQLFEGMSGEFTIKDFSFDIQGETKFYRVVVDIKNLKTPSGADEESVSYTMLEYIRSDKTGYKDAYGEIYNTDTLNTVITAFDDYIQK